MPDLKFVTMSPSRLRLPTVMTENMHSQLGVLDALGFALGLLVIYRFGVIVYRIWFHPLSKFPGPKLLAATKLPYLYGNHIKGSWVRDVAKLHRKYGPIVRMSPNHLSLDGSIGWPEVYAHRVGGKAEYRKVPEYFFPNDWQILINATPDIHRRQRRQLGHAFSKAAMYEQEPIISRYIDLFIEQLSKRAQKDEPIDIVKWLNFTTFDIIGDLTFADSFHSLDSSNYHPWVLSIFMGFTAAAKRRFLASYPLLKPLIALMTGTEDGEKEKQHQEFAMQKAKSRMALGAEPGRRDFTTYMMKDTRDGGKGMSETEIILNMPTIITAGSETTATALSGFFFYMSRTPAAYKALANEIRSAFANESDIDMRHTAPLEYLNACVEETLRMYPPAAETPPRISPGDTIAGQYVAAGTLVSVFQWATFRNPDHFAEPDSFRPERWLAPTHPLHETKFDTDNRSVFKPFSHGSRDCIGKNLAYAEMRVIVARFLYHFDFSLAGNYDSWHDDQANFVVWNKSPLMLRLKLRQVEA